jgi:polyisoprenyl-phosphate glycosyltransferase
LTTLSIVVPVYNEEEVLGDFFQRLSAVLATLPYEAEILLVDDGSRDRTPEILSRIQADPRVRVIGFTRNFGHQAALCAGLDHATGDAVILIDADLQDPPEVLPDLVAKWREGYEVVFGLRRRLEESLLKRAVYHSFYRLLRGLANVEMPMDTGDFSLIDRRIVDHIRSLPERTRFLRGLRSWVGPRQIGVEYTRHARHQGESKYSVPKLFKLAFDGIVSFSTAPLKLALVLGLVVSAGGFVAIGIVVYLRVTRSFDLPGWTSLMVIVLFLGGIQLVTIGIVGEYIARIYEEVKARPLYLVGRRAGFPAVDEGGGPAAGTSTGRRP